MQSAIGGVSSKIYQNISYERTRCESLACSASVQDHGVMSGFVYDHIEAMHFFVQLGPEITCFIIAA